MNIQDIKTLLENKLATLESQKNNAISQWDMALLLSIESDIIETTITLNSL